MHDIKDAPLDLHPNLLDAYAQLYPTVESFLISQEQKVVPEDTPSLDFTHQAEESLLQYIRTSFARAPVSGNALQDAVKSNCRILVTGCESVDEILCGGIREGQITEFVGASSTGKTQICLQLAAITALRGETVLYVDTTGNFSGKRLSAMTAASLANAPDSGATDPLKNVHVLKCHEVDDLLASLKSLDEQTQRHMESEHSESRVRLVLIDSIAGPISSILGGGPSFQGHSLMVETATCLKRIAARHNFAVAVTNHVSAVPGGPEGLEQPALGESWRNQPHTRVLLTRSNAASTEADGQGYAPGGPQRQAVLLASLLAPVGSTASFHINSEGVFGSTARR